MSRIYSQKEIFQYLDSNPLGVSVHMGALEDLNGNDYIMLDYLNDVSVLSDDSAVYQTLMQITCLTKDYEDRKTLVDYVKQEFLSSPTYEVSNETEYYVARFNIAVFLYKEET